MKTWSFFKQPLFEKFFAHYGQWLALGAVMAACSWSVFIPGLGTGHDLNHQARVFEMAQGLVDGNFPVIWSQNLTYGYGMPLFEFYAPLPYLIGAVFYLLGFNLQHSVEAMVLLANGLTIVGGYLLGRELFKSNWASVLAAAFITLAPYRAVDIFVRTAVSEGWAIACIPFVLLGVVQIVRHKKYGWLVLACSLLGLILSHNLTALMAVPFIGVFGLCFLLIEPISWSQRIQRFALLICAGLLGLGLAAFYFIPVFAEKNFTKVDEYTLSSYYDFRQHFLYIRQFVEPWGTWEYGGSGWGPNDEMSFFLGFGQLAVLAMVAAQLAWAAFTLQSSKHRWRPLILQLCLFSLVGLSLVVTLLKVQKLWELVSFTAYFQFPWRFLALTVVFGGLLAGSSYLILSPPYRRWYGLALFILLLACNTRYFQSEKYRDHSAAYANYATTVRNETSNNLYDYIPKTITFLHKVGFYVYKNPEFKDVEVPATQLFTPAIMTQYQPEIIKVTSTQKLFAIPVLEPTQLTLQVAYYPGWTATANGQPVTTFADAHGLLSFEIPSGMQTVNVVLEDTPVRFWSKIISLISIGVTLVIIFVQSKRVVPRKLNHKAAHTN